MQDLVYSPRQCRGSEHDIVLFLFLSTCDAAAAPKVHVITFGKWTTAPWYPEAVSTNEKPVSRMIRPLGVDGRVKE
jgi:hypothetical protein